MARCVLLLSVLSTVCAQSVIRMSQGPDLASPELQPAGTGHHHPDKKQGLKEARRQTFSFASYYGNHMVLQRAPQRATIWGYHPDPGTRIIVQVKGRKVYPVTVEKDGMWRVLLEAESSAGPFTISAHAEAATITLSDVLFGDVWLCSGQSNMQFTLDMMFNASQEIERASRYQQVRVFTANLRFSQQPLDDLVSVLEPWSLPSNKTLGVQWKYFSAICWLFGRQLYDHFQVPVGLIDSNWGGTPVEAWMSKDALARCGLKPGTGPPSLVQTLTHPLENGRSYDSRSLPFPLFTDQNSNGVLWNAMIHPLLPMTIYGAIWDQGEADSGTVSKRNNYNCTFPAMIDDWRAKFSTASSGQTNATFPFGFVQLGTGIPDHTVTVGYPDIRWHQTADYGYVPNHRLRNVFMSVTLDLPDFSAPFGPVHTRDKWDIAHRLFLGGLDVAYGIPTVHQGPLPVKVTQLVDGLVLDYGKTWTLDVRQSEGFELCCSLDGGTQCVNRSQSWWVPTAITTSNTTHVTLFAGVCGQGQNIVGLRYAWRLTPCAFKQCAVYSVENSLPAPPFVVYTSSTATGAKFTLTVDWTKPKPL